MGAETAICSTLQALSQGPTPYHFINHSDRKGTLSLYLFLSKRHSLHMCIIWQFYRMSAADNLCSTKLNSNKIQSQIYS